MDFYMPKKSKHKRAYWGGWFPYNRDYDSHSDDNDDFDDGGFDGGDFGGFDGGGMGEGRIIMKKIVKEATALQGLYDEFDRLKNKFENFEASNFDPSNLRDIFKARIKFLRNRIYNHYEDKDPDLLRTDLMMLVRIFDLYTKSLDVAKKIKAESSDVVNEASFEEVKDKLKNFLKGSKDEILRKIEEFDRKAQFKDNDMFDQGVLARGYGLERKPWFKRNEALPPQVPVKESFKDKLMSLVEEYQVSDEQFDLTDEEKENQAFDQARSKFLYEMAKAVSKFIDPAVQFSSETIDNRKEMVILQEVEEYLEEHYPNFGYWIDSAERGGFEISYTTFDPLNPDYEEGAEEAVKEALYYNGYLSKPDERIFHRENPDIEQKELAEPEEEEINLGDEDEDDLTVDKSTRKKLIDDLEDEVPVKPEKDDLPMLPKDMEEDELEDDDLNESIKKLLTKRLD